MKTCVLLLGLALPVGLAQARGPLASPLAAGGRLGPAALAADTTAEKMLAIQRRSGGWPKAVSEVQVDYRCSLGAADLAAARRGASQSDATIDNDVHHPRNHLPGRRLRAHPKLSLSLGRPRDYPRWQQPWATK